MTSRNGVHYERTKHSCTLQTTIQHMILPAFPLIRLVFYGDQEQLQLHVADPEIRGQNYLLFTANYLEEAHLLPKKHIFM